jgi:replicative superfamily II helicase
MPLQIPLNIDEQIQKLNQLSDSNTNLAKELYIKSIFAEEFGKTFPSLNGEGEIFERILFGLETVGFDLIKRSLINALPEYDRMPWKELIWPAYRLRRTLSFLSADQSDFNVRVKLIFKETLNGLLSHRQPELRFRLQDIDLVSPASSSLSWDKYLEVEIKRAFLLTVRKANGYSDLDISDEIITRLRSEQKDREVTLHDIEDPVTKQSSAIRALALYNCAKEVELTNDFVRGVNGKNSSRRKFSARGIKDEIDKFIFNAREITSGFDPLLRQEMGQLGQACHCLIDASVFSLTLPRRVRDFVSDLSSRDADNPVLEFWFSQREAINSRLLDPTRTAMVISMPTSTGKTLLAELAIIQAHHDDPNRRIVYLAPTKALVTQVTLILKKDLQKQGLKVRVATPAFELNPIESEILKSDFDILVTTPEKLDLLIKSDHESVGDISLVIVDEAHNMADKARGAGIELLLATLRRERECRFLLMTPFAENAKDLSIWLGDDQGAHIVLDWKPNDRIIGVFTKGRKVPKKDERSLMFKTLSSAHSDCPSDVEFDFGIVPENTLNKKLLAVEGVKKWASVKKGGVLLLARSRKMAAERATLLAKDRLQSDDSRSVDLVCRFLDTEAGVEHPLSVLLKKGVAFHHAGLSPEARYFVERLVEDGSISIICATTTLAQGVNFPLSAAVIEYYHRSFQERGVWHYEEIKPWEFWNIAGRVGRTLKDSLGTIAFVSTGAKNTRGVKDIDTIRKYLKKDAGIIVSSLIETLNTLQNENIIFNTELIRNNRSLSAFFQYLIHALAVAGKEEVSRELENLLRSSFVFLEAQKRGQDLADRLIRLARDYVADLDKRKGSRLSAYAKMADGTGFSSPSVDLIFASWKDKVSPTEWSPGALFHADGTPDDILSDAMKTLGKVPEIRLGSDEPGVFDPIRIATITTAWVNGVSLFEIAKLEFDNDLLECTRHIYSTISSLVPWGLRAIQKVAFSGRDDVAWEEMDMIPAMVLHGVRSKEAVALRMLNIPRFIAENMAAHIRASNIPLKNIDEWLTKTSPDDWSKFVSPGSTVSGPELKLLWEIIDGQKSWSSIDSGHIDK